MNTPDVKSDRPQAQAELETLRARVTRLTEERDELELLLETTTDHSDAVEEELHDKAEEALRQSERQLRMIVDATPVPVIISRIEDGTILYANKMSGPFYGLSVDSLVGQPAQQFYKDIGERRKLFDKLTGDGEVNRHELQLRTAVGSTVWAEVSLRNLEFNGERSVLVALHDVTERKRAAQALQDAVEDLTRINEASGRFVPRAFLDFLKKESIVDINLGDHVSREMTVMFSDLRAFTSMSESMSPQENFDFVNAYLRRVSPVVQRNNGFIVKFLGDGMMVIFPDNADDAIRAGVEQLEHVDDYNDYRHKRGREPIQVGIGANTGHMMVGMVGDATRMQGDAFSDNVNLTARIESLTKFYGVSFIVTAETYGRLARPDAYQARFIDMVRPKGKNEALKLYEIFDADTPAQRDLKLATRADFSQALDHYYARDFAESQAMLFGVLQRNPQDKVAWHHLVRATKTLEEGVAEDWSGVTVMTEK